MSKAASEGGAGAAFDRLDELMSRQPPNAQIPKYAPLNPEQPVPPADSFTAMWDEMWGLWFPTTAGGAR